MAIVQKQPSKKQRPKPLAVRANSIPAGLRENPQWVVWRYTWKPDKKSKDGSGKKGDWDKPPFDAKTGKLASTTDPLTWATFEQAWNAYRSGDWDGIGLVLTDGLGLVGIDLDGCRDRDSGVIEPWAQEIIDEAGSYAETSPSGRGIRVIAKGVKPVGRCRKGHVEMYSTGRYLTFTGHHLDGTPARVLRRPKAIARLHARLFPPAEVPLAHAAPSANDKTLALNDDEIVRKAGEAKNGTHFKSLWSGSTNGYPSASEADLALCGELARWTRDAEQIDRLFRLSGLHRAKWERADYRERTIAKALVGKTEFYGREQCRQAEDSKADNRPTILIDVEEHKTNDEAIAALANDLTIYQRKGLLVRIVKDNSPAAKGLRRPVAPRIDCLPQALLSERMTVVAKWFSLGEKGPRPAHPPGWCVAAVHARSDWPGIRHLEAVVDYPVLRPDGSILDRPGYDPETGLLLAPVGKPPEVPENPSKDEAIAARDLLLTEVVSDFPFQREEHRAAWLASLLTPLARFAFSGKSPLFLVDSNVRGSGKGLLLQATSVIVTGAEFPTAAFTDNEEELRKRITSVAVSGTSMVLFDNVVGAFGNAVLDNALTSPVWEDRVLGGNRMFRGPLNVTWFATGNNVVLAGDTCRRVCHVRLESEHEKPEERDDFKHPNLVRFVHKNQHRLLGAALTILRAYCAAGRPDMKLKPWGSFEAWSELVRGAVAWIDLPDPGETRLHLQDFSDSAVHEIKGLLDVWKMLDEEGKGLTTSKVISTLYAAHNPSPDAKHVQCRAILEDILGSKPDAQRLGCKLRSIRRRVFAGRYLDHMPVKRNVVRWGLFDAHQLRSESGGESG
jgi:hypothetical protein